MKWQRRALPQMQKRNIIYLTMALFNLNFFKRKKSDVISLDSISDMIEWLNEQKNDSDAIVMSVLHSQIQLLQTMQNPIVQSMAMDTLVMSLYKSLQCGISPEIKRQIRDCYALMLQTLMAFNESTYIFEINRNRKETEQILSSTGSTLAETIININLLFTKDKEKKKVKVSNVYESPKSISAFFKAIRATESYKTNIEELKHEYLQMLEHLFGLLDEYSTLFGESIVICGMAQRYYEQLSREYRIRKCAPLLSKIKKANIGKTLSLISKIENFDNIGTAISSLFTNTTTYLGKEDISVEEIITMEGNLDKLIENATQSKQQLLSEIDALKEELKHVGLFARSKKEQILLVIEKKQNQINEIEQRIEIYADNRRSIESVYQEAVAIFDDINAYNNKYKQIIDRYTMHISNL